MDEEEAKLQDDELRWRMRKTGLGQTQEFGLGGGVEGGGWLEDDDIEDV